MVDAGCGMRDLSPAPSLFSSPLMMCLMFLNFWPQSRMSEADQANTPVEELTHFRAASLLPEQLLQGGEVIVLLIKPSPWYIVLESLRFLAGVVLVLVILLFLIGQGYSIGVSPLDLVLLAIGTAGARIVWQLLEWLSRVYVLTDRRVIRIKGVLRIQVFEAQLKKIQHTHTLFTIRERLFGLGTIGFATAGTGYVEATWRMVVKPLDVHQIVVQTLDRYR